MVLNKTAVGTYLILLCTGCAVSASFSGGSISPEIQTFSVKDFPNEALLVVPSLSSVFTEGLKDKIERNSRLNLVEKNGDTQFEGRITRYSFRPLAISGNDVAEKQEIRVTVEVIFTNTKNEAENFKQTFSAKYEYPSTNSREEIEEEAIEEMIQNLVDDIYNKAFTNW